MHDVFRSWKKMKNTREEQKYDQNIKLRKR